MRKIILFAVAQVSALKMKTYSEANALTETPPTLEAVTNALRANLTS